MCVNGRLLDTQFVRLHSIHWQENNNTYELFAVYSDLTDKYATLLLKTGCRSNVRFLEQGFGILCRKHDGHLREAWMKRGLTVLQAFVKPCLALCQISGAE